jgi:hypothetical protein
MPTPVTCFLLTIAFLKATKSWDFYSAKYLKTIAMVLAVAAVLLLQAHLEAVALVEVEVQVAEEALLQAAVALVEVVEAVTRLMPHFKGTQSSNKFYFSG